MKLDFSTQLHQINQRFKLAKLPLQFEVRSARLSLRGTFPPKPHSLRLRPHQQRLSLKFPATVEGLKPAESLAMGIGVDLIRQQFDWSKYGVGDCRSGANLDQQLAAFEQSWWRQHPTSQTTWRTAYAPYLRKLHQTSNTLTLPERIYATLDAIPAETRGRQVCCTALQALADFLHLSLPIPLKTLWGTYNYAQTQPRILPTDAEIETAFQLIPNPHWRTVYALMAIYGLRNHEVFFCHFTSEGTVQVQTTTKTGVHEVWPFHSRWIDGFCLGELTLPNLNLDLTQTTLQRIGQQVTRQFARYDVPFRPYDLRHAWAVRTIHYRLPDSVSAQMMGHSLAVHTRTYQRWLTHRDTAAVVASLPSLGID